MGRIVASSAVAGVLLSAGVVAAWGVGPDPEGHLDANCPDGEPGGGFFIFNDYITAQMFTAEHTAWLTTVRYQRLQRYSGTNGPVTATVRTVDGTGAPTDTVLATEVISGSEIPVGSTFELTVNFGRDAAPVVQGDQYAIALSSSNEGVGQDSWYSRGGNQCGGGQVWTYQSGAWYGDGYGDLDFVYETYLGAPNDGFGQSRLLEGASADEEGTTYGATRQAGEPDHSTMGSDTGWIGAHSVWYRWQALGSGPVTIDTCDVDIDSILAVYTGGDLATLARVVDNNNHADCSTTSSQYGSKVAFDAVAGETYRIAVGDAGSLREARFQINLNGQANEKPTVTALLPASDSSTADRTPVIGARVRDSVTELTEQDITLRVDGNLRNPT